MTRLLHIEKSWNLFYLYCPGSKMFFAFTFIRLTLMHRSLEYDATINNKSMNHSFLSVANDTVSQRRCYQGVLKVLNLLLISSKHSVNCLNIYQKL